MPEPGQVILEEFLAPRVDVNHKLLPGPDGAPVWGIELVFASANGFHFSFYTSAINARAIGKAISERALEAQTKLVPSRMPAPEA